MNGGGRKSKVQRGEGGQTESAGVILSWPVYCSGLLTYTWGRWSFLSQARNSQADS